METAPSGPQSATATATAASPAAAADRLEPPSTASGEREALPDVPATEPALATASAPTADAAPTPNGASVEGPSEAQLLSPGPHLGPADEHRYDVIVLGTGLVESIVAAAVARAGKRVLHLDANAYYGAQWATLPLDDAVAAVTQASPTPSLDGRLRHDAVNGAAAADAVDALPAGSRWRMPTAPGLHRRAGGHAVAAATTAPAGDSFAETVRQVHSRARHFSIELAPKLLLARGDLIALLVSSGVGRYLEFKAVDSMWMRVPTTGALQRVPCSRAEVFASRDLSLIEKNILKKFIEFAYDYEAHRDVWMPHSTQSFRDFLTTEHTCGPARWQLTETLADFVLFAMAFCDDAASAPCAADGLRRTHQYLRSLGQYCTAPLLWPMYGMGEIVQAFCRSSAVFGGVYMLQRSVRELAIATGADGVQLTGAVLDDGTEVQARFLVSDARLLGHTRTPGDGRGAAMSRAVFVVDRALIAPSPDVVPSCVLLTIPPRAPSTDGTVVTLLQLGPSSMACPAHTCVVHMTCRSDDDGSGQRLLERIAHELFMFEDGGAADRAVDTRPRAVWSLFFEQPLTSLGDARLHDVPTGVHVVQGDPTWSATCGDDVVSEARRIFSAMYPDEAFLPAAPYSVEAAAPVEDDTAAATADARTADR